jgi:hypothetical protein
MTQTGTSNTYTWSLPDGDSVWDTGTVRVTVTSSTGSGSFAVNVVAS